MLPDAVGNWPLVKSLALGDGRGFRCCSTLSAIGCLRRSSAHSAMVEGSYVAGRCRQLAPHEDPLHIQGMLLVSALPDAPGILPFREGPLHAQ